MPTKRLPSSANLDHLKYQAKDLFRDLRADQLSAFQRIIEFHPKFKHLDDTLISQQRFGLVDAQLVIAREYGYSSWNRLREVVADMNNVDIALNHNERIDDIVFRQALDFMDEGNLPDLATHLEKYPHLISQRVVFEGDNYFTEPTLIEFVAENPIRQGKTPENIIEVTQLLLSAGAKDNKPALDSTLTLVASGRVARECGVQEPLLDLLCSYGADPQLGLESSLLESEFAAAKRLISLGASMDLAAAAALNQIDDVKILLAGADENQVQLALALSAQHGCSEVVSLLLDAGADPNRFNPPGGHSHCTALHCAAIAGHIETVKVLVEAGARFDIGDIHHDVSAVAWAAHANNKEIVDYFESLA